MTPMDWLVRSNVDDKFKSWVAESGLTDPGAIVEACPRGEWLLSIVVVRSYAPEQIAAAIRPAILRMGREYEPAARKVADEKHAAWLRKQPDSFFVGGHFKSTERSAELAAYHATMMGEDVLAAISKEWACFARGTARLVAAFAGLSGGTAGEALEHARIAEDVRRALPDLAARWSAAMEATP